MILGRIALIILQKTPRTIALYTGGHTRTSLLFHSVDRGKCGFLSTSTPIIFKRIHQLVWSAARSPEHLDQCSSRVQRTYTRKLVIRLLIAEQYILSDVVLVWRAWCLWQDSRLAKGLLTFCTIGTVGEHSDNTFRLPLRPRSQRVQLRSAHGFSGQVSTYAARQRATSKS